MFKQVLYITVPVFSIAGVGYIFGRLSKINMETLNNANMNLFVPILLFYLLTEKVPYLSDLGFIAVATVIVVLGSGLIALIVCRIFNIPGRAMVPNIMFNNSGNLGLPLATLAFGEKLLPLSMLAWIVSVWLNHSVGVWYMSGRLHPGELAKTPAFVAAVIGLVCNFLEWHTPEIFLPGLEILAQVAIPLLLISLGVRLTSIDTSHWKLGLFVAVMKPLIGISVAWLAILALNLSDDEARVMLLFGALPPAVVNFLFAERYNRYPHHSASIVAIGNLASLITIPIVLGFIL